MSSRRYTSYKCPAIRSKHPTQTTFRFSLNILLWRIPKSQIMPLNFSDCSPLNSVLAEQHRGPINARYPGQEIKKIKLLTNSGKFKTECVSLTCKYSPSKVEFKTFEEFLTLMFLKIKP